MRDVTSKMSFLEETIHAVMDAWNVPGLAVSVVSDNDDLVLCHGYANVEKRRPTDPSTLFCIGSATKSLTSLLFATLVEAGKVKWTDPIASVIPELERTNGHHARTLLMSDILYHVSGYTRDGDYERSFLSPLERIESLKFDKRAFKKGEWNYIDFNYALLGLAINRLSSHSYSQLLRDTILHPLDIQDGEMLPSAAAVNRATATSYGVDGKQVISLPNTNGDYNAPTSGLHLSVQDNHKWLRYLVFGERETSRIVSKAMLDEIMKEAVSTTFENAEDAQFQDYTSTGMAMGWYTSNISGFSFNENVGWMFGTECTTFFSAELRLGFSIMLNSKLLYGGHPALQSLLFCIVDLFVGGSKRDYLQIGQEWDLANRPSAIDRLAREFRGMPISDLRGVYESCFGDRISIEHGDEYLSLTMPGRIIERWNLKPVSPNRFKLSHEDPNVERFETRFRGLTTLPDRKGRIAGLRIMGVDYIK